MRRGATICGCPVSDHLRLVTGNLTTGNLQSYEDPGIRIFRGLAADVAMIQEFNVGGNSDVELRTFVDDAFGTDYGYTRAAASGQIPNGIVTRYPILAAASGPTRRSRTATSCGRRSTFRGPNDLFAISVHLLSTSASARDLEAGELVQHIQGLPSGAFVVLGGDFNTGTRSEACVQTLSSVLVTERPVSRRPGQPRQHQHATATSPTTGCSVNASLQATAIPVAIGANRFDNGFVADTRVYSPIDDLAPALAEDSGATNMQHMAVVRDFALPGASPPGD